jgi:hypothetical protein
MNWLIFLNMAVKINFAPQDEAGLNQEMVIFTEG